MHEINQVINELRTAGAITGPAEPVVIIVKERESETTLPLFGLFGS